MLRHEIHLLKNRNENMWALYVMGVKVQIIADRYGLKSRQAVYNAFYRMGKLCKRDMKKAELSTN